MDIKEKNEKAEKAKETFSGLWQKTSNVGKKAAEGAKAIAEQTKKNIYDSQAKKYIVVTQKEFFSEDFTVPKVIKTLYASAVKEKDNMCFVDVYEQPKEKTIYILSVTDENNAKFVLFENAKDIVVGCEDYINNACNKSGNGSNIESCEPGIAERTSDGTWKVVKKANVKFV